jgi:hypothetical protein
MKHSPLCYAVVRLFALSLMIGFPTAMVHAAPPVSEQQVISSEGFLSAHPDLRHRLNGLAQYEKGAMEYALTAFKRAARFGDKPSQAMLGEMYWKGEGVSAQPAEAYIWMDLAAERGYPLFLSRREHFWSAMTAEQRADALARGPNYYDQFGDAVATARLAKVLKRGKREVTGSRVGFVGNLSIILPSPGGGIRVSGEDFYRDEYWVLDQYLAWQDRNWKDLPQGRVEIGPLQSDPASPAPSQKDSGD